MGSKFKELREELDSLGYQQKLLPECIPLVQKLLLDLNTTTVNLQKYMRISQQALEERDLLELGAEPYKCDNGKLIKECNDLHLAFIHFKEQHEKSQRELRNQITALHTQLDKCNVEKNKLINQIQQMEKEKFRKGSKVNTQKNLPTKEKTSGTNVAMTSADDNIAQLNRKLQNLESNHSKVVQDNEFIKSQLKSREEEIDRLYSMLEGGRPPNAASKECCYKNIDSQIVILQEEITRLKREKSDLHLQIKDALAKQHEAMRRALHLAERNRQLEKEMKDVDEIALAVEAECNNTVQGNSQKVARLQDRINESLILIQNLERDNAKLNQTKLELSADLDALKLEKIHSQKQLEKELEDKKNLTNKINSFTIIENALNIEIDRLTKLSTEQRRRIAQLESDLHNNKRKTHQRDSTDERLASKGQFGDFGDVNMPNSQKTQRVVKTKQKSEHKSTCKKSVKSKSPPKSSSPTKLESISETERIDLTQKCCCESGNCIKNLKDLLDKEVEYRQVHAKQSMEDLRHEKEYYMKEYHRVLEQMRNVPSYEISENGITQLKQQLKDKDAQIKQLEDELRRLNSDKLGLQGFGVKSGSCNNVCCKNRDRELEIKTRELNHLEVENNTLKQKLQTINETTVFNEERLKKAFKDMEEHIRKLEDERRDLVKTELTQRSNISHLEDDYRNVKDQLKQTQIELNNQRANYNQLKLLHEQSDRAVSDAQAKVIQVETELANYRTRVRDSSRDTVAQDKEIAKKTSDIQIMKNHLTKLDREKDDLMNNLDEKTEKNALLEDELNAKNKLVAKLENELKELKRKLSKYANESSSQEHIVRSKQQELAILEQDYDKEKRLKDSALLENKRLQNDLTSVSCDCRDARNELEISRRQVEDLKRQLQQYVAEVKRTEDLISHKELERNELLDQFRCLSQEANILESNNHTLETEATQSKIQLSVALDHTSELERKVEHQESIIRSYEKQIADLTAHVAKLEVQSRQNIMDHEQFGIEMKQMRDLCIKLDKEKDNLKKELYGKEDRQAQVQKFSEKLNSEREALQKALDQERNSLEAVEKLLNEARREVTEQRLLNQDLQREVNRLKQKIEELEERLFLSQRNIEKGKRESNEVPKSNVREDVVHFDDASYFTNLQSNFVDDICTAPTKLDDYKLNQGTTSKPVSKATSLISTKTLTMANNFHGSDGLFHGTMDLTKLNRYQPQTRQTSDHDIQVVADGAAKLDTERRDKLPSNATSAFSTKSLLATQKFPGSDGVTHGVIDLTKLDQINECDERCRQSRCERRFLGLNDQQGPSCCQQCVESGERLEPGSGLTKTDGADAEIKKTDSLISENATKCVEFDLLGKFYVKSRDDAVNEIGLTKPSELPPRNLRTNQNQDSKSDTSTRTLTHEECETIRRLSKGLTDLRTIDLVPSKMQYTEGIRNQTNQNLLEKEKNNVDLNYFNKRFDDEKSNANTNRSINDQYSPTVQGNKNTDSVCCNDNSNYQQCSMNANRNCQPLEVLVPLTDPTSHLSLYSGNTQSPQGPSCHEARGKNFPKICRCQKCLSTISISEPSIQKGTLHKEPLSDDVCCKWKSIERKVGLSNQGCKLPPENEKGETVNEKSNKTPKVVNNKENSSLIPDRSRDDLNRPLDGKRNKTIPDSNPKKTEVHSKFCRNSEDSAVFHKVFSMDGIGLECRCCISSFKLAENK